MDESRLVNVMFRTLGDLIGFIEEAGVTLTEADKEALAEYAEYAGAIATLQGRRHKLRSGSR